MRPWTVWVISRELREPPVASGTVCVNILQDKHSDCGRAFCPGAQSLAHGSQFPSIAETDAPETGSMSPRSVMIPRIRLAGVTSKAGL